MRERGREAHVAVDGEEPVAHAQPAAALRGKAWQDLLDENVAALLRQEATAVQIVS